MAVCFLHSCFQVCSREATLPRGGDAGGGEKQDLNFHCLPPPCQQAPGLRLSPAEALLPSALPCVGSARRGLGWHPRTLPRRFFSSTSCSVSVGRGGDRAPGAGQSRTTVRKEDFWLLLLSRGPGTLARAALGTAAAMGVVGWGGRWLCCGAGRGTDPALTSAPRTVSGAQRSCRGWVSLCPRRRKSKADDRSLHW